ncbi:MAG: PhzF family phenazine biosynthesis protein [Candidatus Krumholzibacteria bacterium]|nr:PhzF family phenazine biosynthesis protein [Candidatus Krumholzibacteria bacterium]
MRDLVVKQVDAFTTHPFGGNPAGIITNGDGLRPEEMMNIASEMNLSETAIITLPESLDTDFRVRFFTPSEEVDLSGHVVIAATWALLEEGRIQVSNGVTTITLGTNVGPITVDLTFYSTDSPETGSDRVALKNGLVCGELHRIMMHQSIRDHSPASIPVAEIAGMLGIDASEINGTGLPMEIVSAGLDQLMIPVKSKETILELNPDLIKLGLSNKKNNIQTNHIFSTDTFSEDCVSYSRHFAPAVGMWEDPGTGTAAAGLGNYLLRHGIVTSGEMIMEQGNSTSSLARIIVEVEESTLNEGSARIGGLATTSISREISLESGNVIIV